MQDTEIAPVAAPKDEKFLQPQPTFQETIDSFDLNDKNRALLILVNAAKIAQSKGIYSLEEAELISKAIRAFTVPPGPQPSGM